MKTRKRLPKILIVGTGGHARVVGSVLAALGKYQVVGYLDRSVARSSEKILGLSIIGRWKDSPALFRKGISLAAVAVGDNRERRRLHQQLHSEGFTLPALIHPKAFVEKSVRIGSGALVCAKAMIGAAARVGDGAIINTGTVIDHETRIGAFAHIGPGSAIAGRVTIGEGSFIGIGSRVIDQLTIGAWTTVGAGSVVIHSIPGHATAYGVPAKVRKAA